MSDTGAVKFQGLWGELGVNFAEPGRGEAKFEGEKGIFDLRGDYDAD